MPGEGRWNSRERLALGYPGDHGGRTYAENRPYLLPETLGELTGPVTRCRSVAVAPGLVEQTQFHLDDPGERNVMYDARHPGSDHRVDDLRSYLNEDVLRQVWGDSPAGSCPAKLGRSFPRPEARRVDTGSIFGMDPFHERLAGVALRDAAGSFGFALAGGYAVQAHGCLEPPVLRCQPVR